MTCRLAPISRLLSKDSGNGFTLLGESDTGENLSRQIHITSQLFDKLNGQSEIEHPICEECADNLLDLLDQQLRVTEDEGKDYETFFDELQTQTADIDLEVYDAEFKKLQDEEAELRQQLSSVENERNHVLEQIAQETERAKQLEIEEKEYLLEYSDFKYQALEYEDAQFSADNQLRYAMAQLDKLKKTNVFNDTFHIWHSDEFITINGFRLGRLPDYPVEWNEINAAWGQTVLLLHSLANKMNLTFKRYRLVPYGNYSYIEVLSDKSKQLPLYSSGGIKFLWNSKFDSAMVAFLDCLQQFTEAASKGEGSISLPYKMEKGKLRESSSGTWFSIRTQLNSEEQWTKALKFMLTNMKWALAWVAAQFPGEKHALNQSRESSRLQQSTE